MFSWPGLIVTTLCLLALGAWFLRGGQVQADLRTVPRQNVLLITIDTLRADALGCYGGRAATPALDRLAAEGVRFDFAHAHAVTTLPSHVSILTGQYPFQHGVRDNSGYRVSPDTRTAATLLKQRGYATAAFVGAFPLHSRFGLTRSVDVYDDAFGETRAPTEFVMPERPATAVVALAQSWIAQRGSGGPGGSGLPTEAQSAKVGGANGLSNPESQIPNPWFIWLHVFEPHAPYRPPPPFDAQYAGHPYDGEVAATDAALAPLLDDVRGLGQPTLVIVTGDHGEALGDHGEQSHGLFAYESTLRIPLIITQLQPNARSVSEKREHAPRSGSEVSFVPARHIDILPTILDAVGQPIPSDLPGRTLLPAAERRAGSPSRPTYFEAMSAMLNRGWAPLTGVLVDRDKYIALPIAERYALNSDPGEHANLSGREPERDRTLAAALRGFNASPPGQRLAEDSGAAARLRALGYLAGSAPAKGRYTDADDPKRLVDVDQAVHRAVEAFGAGRAADAIQIYQSILDHRPDMGIAYRHLAFIDWQRGDANAAIETLRKAIRNGVADPKALTELGGYLTDAGRAAEAIRLLEPVAASSSADADALNALGIAYARAGRGDEAGRVFERVLAINPESSVPLENLGVLALERGDLAAARQRFERAVRVDPRSSRAFGGLGAAASRSGDRQTALEAWTKAVQLDPRNFDALHNLGVTLARAGHMDEARPYLEQFLRGAPPAFYASDLREVAKILSR